MDSQAASSTFVRVVAGSSVRMDGKDLKILNQVVSHDSHDHYATLYLKQSRHLAVAPASVCLKNLSLAPKRAQRVSKSTEIIVAAAPLYVAMPIGASAVV